MPLDAPVTMAVSPAAEMPVVTSSAVELQEKPEGPRRPSSQEVIIFLVWTLEWQERMSQVRRPGPRGVS
uniref:Uncharacterized protein n=1 Tax=Arundo donax TaxID=35708 RepID=A0A0A9E9H2_ARUDO